MRNTARALVAVVQRAKDGAWVLPRGKLKRDEPARAAARREVVEETGHHVAVNEFLGAITYRAGGKSKVVQFWQMQAQDDASHDLMADIVAVDWLSLEAAVRRLRYPLEKLFLRRIGRRALQRRDDRKLPRPLAAKKAGRKSGEKAGKNKIKDKGKSKGNDKGKGKDKNKDKTGRKSNAKHKAKPKKSRKSRRTKKTGK